MTRAIKDARVYNSQKKEKLVFTSRSWVVPSLKSNRISSFFLVDIFASAELGATNLSIGQGVVYSNKVLSNRETGTFMARNSRHLSPRSGTRFVMMSVVTRVLMRSVVTLVCNKVRYNPGCNEVRCN